MERIIRDVVPTYSVVTDWIKKLDEKYTYLHAASCGKSVLGKDIYAVTAGSGAKRILYAGGTHGTEWLTVLLLLKFIETLSVAAHTGGTVAGFSAREILADCTLVVVPAINPDGIEIAISGEDACGFCRDICIEASGGDFTHWKANARGVDINHNFDAGWALLHEAEARAGILGPAPTRYGGPRPESEPETAAMVRLVRELSFRHILSFHSQGEELYWEYGSATPEKSLTMARTFSALSEYTLVKNDGLASHGGFKDWFIDAFGRPGFTVEIGSGENPLPLWQIEGIAERLLPMMTVGLML